MKTLEKRHPFSRQIQFEAASPKGFKDVSILTVGEAEGHGVMIDEKTIEQFMALALGKTIPAYLTHAEAIDENGRPNDRLGNEIGMFSGFYRDGDKVRARQFNFLQSFIDNQTPVYSTIVSLAADYPDKLGISPVMGTRQVWCMPDGVEVPSTEDDDEELMSSRANPPMPVLRVMSIKSCDFVQQPAANVGLFHAKVDGKPNKEPEFMATNPDTILLSKHTEEVTSLQTQHKDAITALETKHKEAVTALEAKLNDATAKLAQATEKEKNLTAALAAKATEADEAAKYDMRKAGAPALEIALQAHTQRLPEPKGTDREKWEQYGALCKADKDSMGNVTMLHETPVAKAFKEKYLTRK